MTSVARKVNDLERLQEREAVVEIPRWVYLQSPLTSTLWDGDARSTTGKTIIDLSEDFGVPGGIKAILARIVIRDSGSAATNCYFILSPTSTNNEGFYATIYGYANDLLGHTQFPVPCNIDGDVYYQLTASGSDTMDVWIEIWGYEI